MDKGFSDTRSLQSSLPDSIAYKNLAFSKLIPYVKLCNPRYIVAKHNVLIAEYLEALERGDITRLLILTPPRHGKTMLVSQYFVSWYLGRNPEHSFIATTYSNERSNDIGREVRNQMLDPLHKSIFHNCTVSSDSKSVSKLSTLQGGNYYSVGTLGAITGRGANCVVGDTKISTTSGEIEIAKLIDMAEKPMVLSLGEDGLSYKPIIAYRKKNVKTIYSIKTCSGHTIRTTGDHRFYIYGQGYTKAADLSEGQRIVKTNDSLFDMREATSSAFKVKGHVPGMLSCRKKESDRNRMFLVSQKVFSKCLRCEKVNKTWAQRFLLFIGMLKGASCYKKSSEVCCLRKAYSEKNDEVLFEGMQTLCEKVSHRSFGSEVVQILREIVRGNFYKATILFKKMSKCCPFFTDDRFREFSLQDRNKLFEGIRRNTAVNCIEGFSPLCCLPTGRSENGYFMEWPNCQTDQFGRASYRQRSNEQRFGELDFIVQDLSCSSSQIETDTISMVSKVCDKNIPVYDIQVSGNENFFANGVLVHNCFLIDDPVKGREDADSKTIQQKIQDWFTSVAYTRLMGKGRIGLVMTRWSYFDLAGYLLNEKAHENWVVLNLPALAEEDGDILNRKRGEALWPEKFPEYKLKQIRDTIGSRDWNALYQQRPTPMEGGMIKLDDIRRYDNSDFAAAKIAVKMGIRRPKYNLVNKNGDKVVFKKIVCSWDTAFKESELNDPSACTVWGVADNGFYLIDVFNKQLEFPKLRAMAINLHSYWQKFISTPVPVLIEDKASGQSLIQELRRFTRIPVIAITPEGSKKIRLDEVSVFFEAGKVYFPYRAKWLHMTETQLERFPYDVHDDICDSISQFLKWIGSPKYIRSKNPGWWK